jgi:hypothetical protein
MLIPVGMVVFGYYLDLLVEYLPQLDRLVYWSAIVVLHDGRHTIGAK